ncbi:hypothetical protein SAY87_030589 [Trapa incisa]|uniref:DYW domain-containing protein n=1 Tax=Trapa incisa TaxID=236973 RepID=A0AAN7QJV1_9MYRT|nr:hypothetical protein SAY87_030589 [Trapa incisa]
MIERQRFANFLRHCSKNALLSHGLRLHGALLATGFGQDIMLNNDLIDMHSKCGRMDLAQKVFDRMLERNVVSWTALMCGFLQNGDPAVCLSCFTQMMTFSHVRPNDFTLSTALKASGMSGVLECGLQVQGLSVKLGFDSACVVGNCAIDMYSKCWKIDEAERVFWGMPFRNLISWNVMIAGYVLVENGYMALALFRKMREGREIPDDYTFASMFKACSSLGAFLEGSQMHGFLITIGFPILSRAAVAGAIVDFYIKCGYISEARKMFDQIEEKNIITWSALILGYAQGDNLSNAMDLFTLLRLESPEEVDGFVISSLIGVFADFALAEQGKQMHAYTVKVPCGWDISVVNSILDMYLKCGLLDDAEKYFGEIPLRNVVSWTAMITGYGKHGLGKGAVNSFNKMQSENIKPDAVSYLAVLTACSHSGLLEESQEIFLRLCCDSMVKPQVEHFSCMVDVLGRSGRVQEAKNVIECMPIRPNVGIWQTLLSACKVHGYLELGQEVGEVLLKMDSSNPVNYVMMSNIYLDAGYYKKSENVRELVKRKRLEKVGGCSWVEIDKKMNFFYSGDDSHPLIDRIHEVLNEMNRRVKQETGYMYKVRFALHDVEEESKEESLRVHSEKLAIGLALVCGGLEQEGRVIRVFKNLRVCGDCHEFIKGLSRILKVVFIVRDANRFHKFQDGFCSCRDYW